MKIVTTYVAFDDEEFSNVEDCQRYENFHIDLIIEAEECYSFYDRDMNRIVFAYCHNIEEMLNEFCYAYDYCEYIVVNKEPSAPLINFMRHYFGYELPMEKGTWRWNNDFGGGEWKRV